jgi:hypothetical protein
LRQGEEHGNRREQILRAGGTTKQLSLQGWARDSVTEQISRVAYATEYLKLRDWEYLTYHRTALGTGRRIWEYHRTGNGAGKGIWEATDQIRLRIPSIAQVERLGIKQNSLGTRARRTACLLALVTASASTSTNREYY